MTSKIPTTKYNVVILKPRSLSSENQPENLSFFFIYLKLPFPPSFKRAKNPDFYLPFSLYIIKGFNHKQEITIPKRREISVGNVYFRL